MKGTLTTLSFQLVEFSLPSVVPCEQLVSPTPNERETTASNRLLLHWACASSSRPTWYIWCQFHLSIYISLQVFEQKNANFFPKALTKEQSIPSSKYCIYWLSCLLSCRFAELVVEHNTPDPPPNNNLKQYNWQQVCNSELLKWLDLINIKNRSALKVLEEEFQQCTACIVSKNHKTSFYILTQPFAVDLDFVRCTVGSLTWSSCAVEHIHASLNWLLN